MSMHLVFLGFIFLFMMPFAVLLSVNIGNLVCLCPKACKMFMIGWAALMFENIADNSASVDEDKTCGIICYSMCNGLCMCL